MRSLAVLALLLTPFAPARAVLPDGLFAAEAESPDEGGSSFPPLRRLYAASLTVSTQGVSGTRAETRAAAVLALGRLGRVELVERILKEDKHWWVRYAAASVLPKAARCGAVDALERAAAADAQWQVRVRAVQSLAELKAPGAVAAMGAALEDKDDGVRAAGAYGLAEVGGAEALAVLQRRLRVETDPLHRQLLSAAAKRVLAEDPPAGDSAPACALDVLGKN